MFTSGGGAPVLGTIGAYIGVTLLSTIVYLCIQWLFYQDPRGAMCNTPKGKQRKTTNAPTVYPIHSFPISTPYCNLFGGVPILYSLYHKVLNLLLLSSVSEKNNSFCM